MPPYPFIPDGYGLIRHHILTPGGNGHAYVIYGVKLTATPTALQVATELHGDFAADPLGSICSNYTLNDTQATINEGGDLLQAVYTNPAPGAATPPSVPVNCSMLVRKQTGAIGKHFRGRMFIPGIADTHVNTDRATWASSFVTSVQSDYNAFLALINGGTHVSQMVLFHRLLSIPPSGVSSLTVESELATQRRRLRKAPHH